MPLTRRDSSRAPSRAESRARSTMSIGSTSRLSKSKASNATKNGMSETDYTTICTTAGIVTAYCASKYLLGDWVRYLPNAKTAFLVGGGIMSSCMSYSRGYQEGLMTETDADSSKGRSWSWRKSAEGPERRSRSRVRR